MMNLLASTEFKVGILVLTVSVIVAVMSMRVSEDPAYMGSAKTAWFLIDDASGLVVNSAVKTAGINVGVIREISLQDGLARVEMSLRADVRIYQSAKIEIRASGILGDRHIEIVAGSPSDPLLPNAGQIGEVEDRGSMDALLNEVGKITKSLGSVATTLQKSIEGDGDRSSSLGRIINNIEMITQDVSGMTADNKDDIRNIISKVSNISDTLDEFINGEGPDGFKPAWRNATQAISRLEPTIKNIEQITDKINRGEGTIGRLVNDETTIDELNEAIEGVNSFISVGSQSKTSLEFNSVYLGNSGESKSNIGFRFQPGLDRYYELAVVDDPGGVITKETNETTANGGAPTTTTSKKTKDTYRFTLLFAKNFWDLTLKGGLIENTGGFGMDYWFYRRKGVLTAEFFDFEKMNVRTSARYYFTKSIFVAGGVEDMFNNRQRYSNFLGAGIFLTNDDLKALVASGSPF